MGFTRLMLFRQRLTACVFYTRAVRIDLAETFHLHWRNLRLELDAGGFRRLVRWLLWSYVKWTLRGQPATRPPDQFLEFINAEMPALEGDLRIELQQQTDYVHVHYRDLRIELTYEEFLALADAFDEARSRYGESPFTSAPRRIGFDHKTNPKRRVGPGTGDLWIGDDRPPDCLTYESMLYDPVTKKWRRQF